MLFTLLYFHLALLLIWLCFSFSFVFHLASLWFGFAFHLALHSFVPWFCIAFELNCLHCFFYFCLCCLFILFQFNKGFSRMISCLDWSLTARSLKLEEEWTWFAIYWTRPRDYETTRQKNQDHSRPWNELTWNLNDEDMIDDLPQMHWKPRTIENREGRHLTCSCGTNSESDIWNIILMNCVF